MEEPTERLQEPFPCTNCDTPTTHLWGVCDKCKRDPDTNNCDSCGKHLSGIPYPYTCGECIHKGFRKCPECQNSQRIIKRKGRMVFKVHDMGMVRCLGSKQPVQD